MTVAELRKALEDLPEDMEVFLVSDPEGNNYYEAYEVDLSDHVEVYGEPVEERCAVIWPA